MPSSFPSPWAQRTRSGDVAGRQGLWSLPGDPLQSTLWRTKPELWHPNLKDMRLSALGLELSASLRHEQEVA